MKEKDVIINRYKNALCDDYYTYLDVIDHLNRSIPNFAEGMGFSLNEEIKFDYPEFCKKFLVLLRISVHENKNLFDQSVIYQIFEQMILEKILDNITEDNFLFNEDFNLDNEF
jgi:hypothetical protein